MTAKEEQENKKDHEAVTDLPALTPEEELKAKIDDMLNWETTEANPAGEAWDTHETLPRLSIKKFMKEAPDYATPEFDPEKTHFKEWRDAKGWYFGQVDSDNKK